MEFSLISLRPGEDQRAELIDNILAVYHRATADQRAQGMAWYREAHELALIAGGGNGMKGAGMIAALSMNNSWDNNKRQALNLGLGLDEVRGLSLAINRARRIAEGEYPLDVLVGHKTRAFYLNIANPDYGGPVTIDRHAHDLARGQRWGNRDRGLDNAKRYEVLQSAYNLAAARVGLYPHELQAITWVVWREEK